MGVVGRLDQYASMLAWEFDDYSMSENLLSYSDQFNDASWAKNNYNVTANATTAPDGTLTADKLIAINASTFHDLFKTPSLSSSHYTLSIFAKAAEQSFIQVRIDDGVLSRVAMFNLSTGSVSSSSNVTSSTIASYPNGWYRCSIAVSSAIVNVVFNGFPTSSNANYSGDGTSGVFIWGAQLERGTIIGMVPTDYTQTTTTSISRVQDSRRSVFITSLGTYYSSGFDENVGFTTFLSANVFAPYNPVYDEFSGTLFGAGQGRYMRQNTDKSVIVYNEIDEVTDLFGRGIVRDGLVLDLDAGISDSYPGSGTTWTDLGVYSNNGTLTNGPTYSSSNDGYLIFDGTNDYVDCGNPTNLQITVGTISAWFNANNGNAGFNSIIAKQNAWSLFVKDNVLITYDWGNNLERSTGITVGNSTWNYAVMTFTETVGTPSNNAIIYLNGNPVLTTTVKHFLHNINVQIGEANAGQCFGGNISQASIYNRALTAAEITQNYNALKYRFGL